MASTYLERYEELKNMEKAATESEALETQRKEVIEKYASLATDLLTEEHGEGNFSNEDIEKLAVYMIDHDIEAEENIEKEAENTDSEEDPKEVIEKYAAFADNLLAEEYGEDYEEEDVVKLATLLIEDDLQAEELEKYAEFEVAGQVMAASFLDALSDTAEDAEEEKVAEEEEKTAAENIVDTIYGNFFPEDSE